MEFLGEYRYHRLYKISTEAREVNDETGNHFVRNHILVFAPKTEQQERTKEWGSFENIFAAKRAIDEKCEKAAAKKRTEIENVERKMREENLKTCTQLLGAKNKNRSQR